MSAAVQIQDSGLDKLIEFDPGKWFYGIGVLLVFLILVFIVTRFNIDR